MPTPNYITYREKTHGVNSSGYDDVFNRPSRTVWDNFCRDHNKDGTHISTLSDGGVLHEVGTYTGDGTDDRVITLTQGIAIDYIRIWSSGYAYSVSKTSSMTGDVTIIADGTSAANMIQDITDAGQFEVGSHAAVNQLGIPYYYLIVGTAAPFNPSSWSRVAATPVESGRSFSLATGLAVYDGAVHGAFYPSTGDPAGVCRFTGTAWDFVASYTGISAYESLLVSDGNLYIGATDGTLLKWNGATCTELVVYGNNTWICGLVEYNGTIYGTTRTTAGNDTGGRLLEFDGVDTWTVKATRLSSDVLNIRPVIHNDKIYCTCIENGNLYEWNGTDAWVSVASAYTDANSLINPISFGGYLYASSSTGKLLRWNGTNAWELKADTLSAEEGGGLASHAGNIYMGTRTNGKLYRWNGTDAWVSVCNQYASEQIAILLSYGVHLYASTYNGAYLLEAV